MTEKKAYRLGVKQLCWKLVIFFLISLDAGRLFREESNKSESVQIQVKKALITCQTRSK